jgi:hypothetical protein
MMWSKLKQLTEARMAPALAGRVELHSTRYPKADDGDILGRGWLTLDRREIANFCDYTRLVQLGRCSRGAHAGVYNQQKDALRAEGVLSRWDFHQSLWNALSLSIDDLLASDNILLRALAMTDRRLGKRRLRSLEIRPDEHPLVQLLYALRCEAEGIRPSAPRSFQPQNG